MAFDPALNLLYIGVGNGSPWNRWVRSPDGGDNLFLSSIVALNPDTGAYVWHYQTTPGDTWDYTATQHIVLAELDIDGENRSVLMQAPKNGFFYVLDRATGELISAEKYAPVSWASHVDMATGRPVETSNADHSQEMKMTAPAALGAHNWQPMAFNKAVGLVFIPAMEAMMPYSTAKNFIARKGGHWNLGQDGAGMKGGSMGQVPNALAEAMVKKMLRGNLIAWDPVTQQERWRVKHPTVWNGGILTTKSGLVFQGTGDQRFIAYDASSGEKLWEAPTGTGIVAPPVTYEIDGEQYIAVMAGWGGVGGLTLPNVIQSDGTSRMLVYKLGATAPHPLKAKGFYMAEAPPASSASSASVANGESLYNENCNRCHGQNIGRGGVIPDLRYMNAGTRALFDDIVRGGLFRNVGMVSFSDVLGEEETQDIHNYLIHMANKTWDDQNASGWWHEFVLWVFDAVSGIIAWFMT
jgi:quinohemoprotein ethanol dehydrogenase